MICQSMIPWMNSGWNVSLNAFGEFLSKNKYIIGAIATVAILKHLRSIHVENKRRKIWSEYGEDVVILHSIHRGYNSPSLSPFVIKLEVYLRMTGIKYVFDSEVPLGPKGRLPWITINGEDIADSEFIIQFLSKKFGKDVNSQLTEEQKAIGRAFCIMADESLFYGLAYWRVVKGVKTMAQYIRIPFPLFLIFPRIVIKRRLWKQGFGRHSDKEKEEIILKNLHALSTYLGSKKFLMGDTPCQYDCTIFGFLAQYIWLLSNSPFPEIIKKDYKNLIAYCERMKQKYYPDWENAKDQL